MNKEMAVVGNLDTILVFKLVGMDTFSVSDEESTVKTINDIIDKYKLILITEDYAPFIEDIIKETSKKLLPIITIIPSGLSSDRYALKRIETEVVRSLGLNILPQGEQDIWKEE